MNFGKQVPHGCPANSILIVGDDREMRHLLKDILEEHDDRGTVAPEGRAAPDHPGRGDALVVLTDLWMKGLDGFELLHDLAPHPPACNVITMTAFGTVESAVEAMNQGAFDSLTNPINTEELSVPIEKAFREARLRQEVAERRKQVRPEYAFAHVLGKSEVMRAVFEFMRRVADAPRCPSVTKEAWMKKRHKGQVRFLVSLGFFMFGVGCVHMHGEKRKFTRECTWQARPTFQRTKPFIRLYTTFTARWWKWSWKRKTIINRFGKWTLSPPIGS